MLAKVPAHAQGEIKGAYWSIFDTDDVDLPPGPELVAFAQTRIDAFAARYRGLYPAAVKCLCDREQLTCYLRFPPSTTAGSGTRTSSSGPSARLAGA